MTGLLLAAALTITPPAWADATPAPPAPPAVTSPDDQDVTVTESMKLFVKACESATGVTMLSVRSDGELVVVCGTIGLRVIDIQKNPDTGQINIQKDTP